MKTKIFLIVCLVLPVMSFSQNQFKSIQEIKVTPPAFTGIENAAQIFSNVETKSIESYLNQHTEFSSDYVGQGIEVVRFVVTSDGELTDFEIINSVSPVIDRKIIKVLKTTDGMWKPGYNNDTPVSMEKEISVMLYPGEWNQKAPIKQFVATAKKQFAKGSQVFLDEGKPKKALKHYNESIKYLPSETSSLLMRGLCRYALGDREGARSDWERVSAIGKYDADEFIENLASLPGYDEMKLVLNK